MGSTQVPCPYDGRPHPVSIDAQMWACAEHAATFSFYRCPQCGSISQSKQAIVKKSVLPCIWCRNDHHVGRKEDLAVSAGSFALELRERGYDGSDPNSRIASGMTVVGGWGWAPSIISTVSMATSAAGLTLSASDREAPIRVSWANLSSIDVIGEVGETGGGFIGGGFGLGGAIQGMITAEVLNRLTTATTVNTLVHVTGQAGELVAHSHTMPDHIRMIFGPAKAAIANQQTAAKGDIVSQLERIAMLREDGALSDEEFRDVKNRILTGGEDFDPL